MPRPKAGQMGGWLMMNGCTGMYGVFVFVHLFSRWLPTPSFRGGVAGWLHLASYIKIVSYRSCQGTDVK